MVKAVEANTTCRGWCSMCGGGFRRRCSCLTGPRNKGTVALRKGQRLACTRNLFLHYAFDAWMSRSSLMSGSSATWMTWWSLRQ